MWSSVVSTLAHPQTHLYIKALIPVLGSPQTKLFKNSVKHECQRRVDWGFSTWAPLAFGGQIILCGGAVLGFPGY